MSPILDTASYMRCWEETAAYRGCFQGILGYPVCFDHTCGMHEGCWCNGVYMCQIEWWWECWLVMIVWKKYKIMHDDTTTVIQDDIHDCSNVMYIMIKNDSTRWFKNRNMADQWSVISMSVTSISNQWSMIHLLPPNNSSLLLHQRYRNRHAPPDTPPGVLI